ncbi:DUF1636 family protein [Ruegeria lacuscaerulensis]|uniref:DUF1636 family protein n=1 Tax=Ruegeria lacuscaerulensis TaxID=55218 RepID=UPI00147A23C2|nr:DUF1636 family protein [Ruegeria lacuscaerulensis]
MPEAPDHLLLICSTCSGALPADTMRSALIGKLPAGFAIRTADCMAGCAQPTTVGFQAIGKAQYLFGDIQTQQEVEALAEFAHQYCDSADGWTNATDRPRPLFTKTLSRLPRIQLEEPS